MKRLIASALTVLCCIVLFAVILADDPPVNNYPPPPPGYVGEWPPPEGYYIDGNGDTIYVPTDTTGYWPWGDPDQ